MCFVTEKYSFLLNVNRPITSRDYVKVGEVNYYIRTEIVMISKGYKNGKSLKQYIEELKQLESCLRKNKQIDAYMQDTVKDLLRNIEKTLDLVDEE